VMNQGRIEQHGTPEEVFEHPANPFVMDFLGNVNVFHGRVQNGQAMLGSLRFAHPDYPHDESRPAKVYVRPHELEIERSKSEGAVRAEVQRINSAGAVVRVELLASDYGVTLNVDLSPDRRDELNLTSGETVFVSPKRVRVFVPDY